MKQIIEEGFDTEIELDDERVIQHLQQNPDFFIRHARQVEQLAVPHPVRGAVSLVEWQLSRQRQHIFQLEEEITLLMEQAAANEVLFKRLLLLQADLATAESLQDLLNRLHHWARGLGLAGAEIRLFSECWQMGAPSGFAHLALARTAFEPVRIQRLGSAAHYLGSLNGSELLLLLPHARQVGSVALSLLGEAGELGLLIFSSRDSQHYLPGMGTDMLDQLARLLPPLLERWIARV